MKKEPEKEPRVITCGLCTCDHSKSLGFIICIVQLKDKVLLFGLLFYNSPVFWLRIICIYKLQIIYIIYNYNLYIIN